MYGKNDGKHFWAYFRGCLYYSNGTKAPLDRPLSNSLGESKQKNSSVLTATYWNLHFEGAQIICPSQMFCYKVFCSILWLQSFLEVFNHHCKV